MLHSKISDVITGVLRIVFIRSSGSKFITIFFILWFLILPFTSLISLSMLLINFGFPIMLEHKLLYIIPIGGLIVSVILPYFIYKHGKHYLFFHVIDNDW